MTNEEWRPVGGYEGIYEVSDRGRVRNLKTGNYLSGTVYASGHVMIAMNVGGHPRTRRLLHRIVATAFLPNPDNLPVVRHLNDVPGENAVENLAWGTYSDNSFDSVRNGHNPNANKTHCIHGHELTPENVRVYGTHRWCKTCNTDYARAQRSTRHGLPPGDPRHGTVGGYSNHLCRCDECRAANAAWVRLRRAKQRVAA